MWFLGLKNRKLEEITKLIKFTSQERKPWFIKILRISYHRGSCSNRSKWCGQIHFIHKMKHLNVAKYLSNIELISWLISYILYIKKKTWKNVLLFWESLTIQTKLILIHRYFPASVLWVLEFKASTTTPSM